MRRFILGLACLLMGMACYAQGQKYLTEARKGSASAMDKVGVYYNLGMGGLPKDKTKAAYWFKKGAEAGSADAMFHYARDVIGVEEVKQNKLNSQYLFWLEKAANTRPEDMTEPVINAYDGLKSEVKNDKSTYKQVLEKRIKWLKVSLTYEQNNNIRNANKLSLEQDEMELERLNNEIAASNTSGSNDHVFDRVEQMPSFPGGSSALMQFLSNNICYPNTTATGRVVVQFVVEKDGSISNTKVVRSIDPALDKEALRVVSSMPNWIPGKQGGVNIRVKYTIPITFK